MKRIFILFFLLILAVTMPAFASQNEVNAYFDASHGFFAFSGQTDYEESTPVVVCIDYFSDNANFSPEHTPIIIQFFTVGADGSFSGKISMPEYLNDGSLFCSDKYTAFIYYDTDENNRICIKKNFFHITDKDSETAYLLNKINNSENGSEIYTELLNDEEKCHKVGVEPSMLKKYGQTLMDNIIASKTEDYNSITFLSAYRKSVAVSVIGDTDDVESAMKEYADVFGITVDDYIKLDTDCKKELNILLKKTDYTKVDPAEIYPELLEVAVIRSMPSWTAFKDKILESFSKSEYYDKIPGNTQYKVFTQMYSKKENYFSSDDVQKSFDETSKKVYADMKNENTSKSSSGSSSPSTNVSSDKNLLSPKSFEDKTYALTDIKGHFCEEHVKSLLEKSVISGYPDKTFRPDNKISRAEFSKLVCAFLNIKENNESNIIYSDINSSEWFAPYIYALSNQNIVTGYNGKFMPNENISRQDAAVILFRSIKDKLNASANTVDFSDNEDIDIYAKEAVSTLAANKIIQGSENTFLPRHDLTRAEAAVIINKAIEFTK